MKMHLNGFLALYMFRAGALCALPTISACTYMQTADGAYAEGPYVVDSHVSDLYVSCHSDYRILTPCLYIESEDHSEGGAGFQVQSIPNTCRALWVRGNVDLSHIPSNSFVEYVTIDEDIGRQSGYVMSMAEKFPMANVLELCYGSRRDYGVNSLSYEKPLDLGAFAKLRNLQHFDLTYHGGKISNSDALIDNRSIKVLKLAVSRELPHQTPHRAGTEDVAICDKECACRRLSYGVGLVSCVRFEKSGFLGGKERTFRVENSGPSPVELSDIPGCCKRLVLVGRIKLSGVSDYPRVESLCWVCHGATNEDVAALQFSRFPNLKEFHLWVETEHECEIDFRQIDVCHSLESVDMWGNGCCVIRGMDDVFRDDRIKFFFGTFTRDLRVRE